MELQSIVSLSVLIHSAFSGKCRRFDSNTLNKGKYMYLPDSSFKQLNDSSLYSCAAACYSHSICRSFNLNKRTRTCYLNVVDRTCPGRSLTSDSDFMYSSITGWDKGIAGPCERNTCMRDQQCHVTRKRSVICVDSLTESVDYKLEFHLIKDLKTWEEAGKYCTDRCGRLAVVNTAEKNAQVASLMAQENMGNVWLGASDQKTEGVWLRIDGQELGYKDWGVGQPDNWKGENINGEDCLAITTAKWFDKRCNKKFGFVCEYVMP